MFILLIIETKKRPELLIWKVPIGRTFTFWAKPICSKLFLYNTVLLLLLAVETNLIWVWFKMKSII